MINHACNRIDMAVRFGKKQILICVGQYAKTYGENFKGRKP